MNILSKLSFFLSIPSRLGHFQIAYLSLIFGSPLVVDDAKKLFRDYGILAKNLVELGAMALIADATFMAKRKIVSLQKVHLQLSSSVSTCL